MPARRFELRTLGLKDRCSNQAELRRLNTILPESGPCSVVACVIEGELNPPRKRIRKGAGVGGRRPLPDFQQPAKVPCTCVVVLFVLTNACVSVKEAAVPGHAPVAVAVTELSC